MMHGQKNIKLLVYVRFVWDYLVWSTVVSIKCSGIAFPVTEFPRLSYRCFQTLVRRISYTLD